MSRCAEEDAADLCRIRGDQRASKRRNDVLVQLSRLEEDGTTSTVLHTTRPLNQKLGMSGRAVQITDRVDDFKRSVRSSTFKFKKGVRALAQSAVQLTVNADPVAEGPPAPEGESGPQQQQHGLNIRELAAVQQKETS